MMGSISPSHHLRRDDEVQPVQSVADRLVELTTDIFLRYSRRKMSP